MKAFGKCMKSFVAGEMKNMQKQYFRDLPLSMEVMKGIEELGFSNLFPIQAQAITPLLEEKDVIGRRKQEREKLLLSVFQ